MLSRRNLGILFLLLLAFDFQASSSSVILRFHLIRHTHDKVVTYLTDKVKGITSKLLNELMPAEEKFKYRQGSDFESLMKYAIRRG